MKALTALLIAGFAIMATRRLFLFDGVNPCEIYYNYSERRLEMVPEMGMVPQPISTSVLYSAHNMTTNLISTPATPCKFDAQDINTDGITYIPSPDRIEVASHGMYEINTKVTLASNQTNSSIVMWLEQDIGGGFAEVQGTRSYLAMSIFATYTINGSYIVTVDLPSSHFRVMCEETTGALVTQVVGASNMTIKKVM